MDSYSVFVAGYKEGEGIIYVVAEIVVVAKENNSNLVSVTEGGDDYYDGDGDADG